MKEEVSFHCLLIGLLICFYTYMIILMNFLFLLFQSKEKLWLSVLIAVATGIVLHQFFGNMLHYPWPEPQVAIWLDFDWPGM